MKSEDKQLLLKDLCARLPYGIIGLYSWKNREPYNRELIGNLYDELKSSWNSTEDSQFLPYLRPMSSMTEEEARDIAILHGNEPVDILSTKVTDEYVDIILDDGVCGTYTETIWYDEIISSVKCFDYLNKNMFDYHGLIPKDLALSADEINTNKD